MMNDNNYCVIMAGGVGSRFWPLSRNSYPKQFIDILGTGKSLLQQTFDRFNRIIPAKNIYIVSNIEYKNLILEQLPLIEESQILSEPMRRNTAPCIAYANYVIAKQNPDANIVVTPADHLVLKEEAFIEIIKKGLEFTKNNASLLTLGIHPTRPETGYGYIQASEKVGDDENLKKVKIFTEKPNLEMAKFFVESGEFFWNSGIFLWHLNSIQKAFDQYLPEVSSLFSAKTEKSEKEFISEVYSKSKNISIDYGIMEKASNVYVYCSEFGWSDLGTWGSLYEHSDKDENQNAKSGDNVMLYNSKDCIVNVPSEKLVVLHGLENYIVVESNDVLLICKKDEEQEIKQFVNDIKISKGEKYI